MPKGFVIITKPFVFCLGRVKCCCYVFGTAGSLPAGSCTLSGATMTAAASIVRTATAASIVRTAATAIAAIAAITGEGRGTGRNAVRYARRRAERNTGWIACRVAGLLPCFRFVIPILEFRIFPAGPWILFRHTSTSYSLF
jgi:hypothetical protein